MGRQKEFDEAEAIEAAMLVFWQVGFESASLPELLDAMGLSKSSFYHSFGSKEALFERCLGAYADKLVRSLREQLDRSESGLAFLRSVLFSVGEETRDKASRRGCLVMNTANEFGQREPAFAKIVSREVNRFEEVFADALARAEKEDPSQHGTNRRARARYMVCALSGLKTMAKAGATRAEIRDVAGVAMSAFE